MPTSTARPPLRVRPSAWVARGLTADAVERDVGPVGPDRLTHVLAGHRLPRPEPAGELQPARLEVAQHDPLDALLAQRQRREQPDRPRADHHLLAGIDRAAAGGVHTDRHRLDEHPAGRRSRGPAAARWRPAPSRSRSARPGAHPPRTSSWRRCAGLPRRQLWHSPQPIGGNTDTRCPGSTSSAPGPAASTVPWNSWPSRSGGCSFGWPPEKSLRSDPQRPHSATRTTTSPSPGADNSRVSMPIAPGASTRAVRVCMPSDASGRLGGRKDGANAS